MTDILRDWNIDKESDEDHVAVLYIAEFIQMNLSLTRDEMKQLNGKCLPVKNPEFTIIVEKDPARATPINDGYVFAVQYGDDIYDRNIPRHLFNYFVHLMGEVAEIKFPTIESLDAEYDRLQQARRELAKTIFEKATGKSKADEDKT